MFDSELVKKFNNIEMILYNYIINNEKKVISMKIRDLANQTHVSTTSIMRFCKKLGCDGFAEFKVKWKLYLDEVNKGCECLSDNTVFLDFFEKVNYTDFPALIDNACEEIKDAKSIIFVGTGSSGILAKYGARYFSILGKLSLAIDDPYYPINQTLSEDTVAIILSVSGETPAIVKHTVSLREAKCRIVSITNSANCTVAKLSSVNIPYYISSEMKGTSDLTSQVPAVYILEALAKKLHTYIAEK